MQEPAPASLLVEARRLEALSAYELMDSAPDPNLDTLTALGCSLLGVNSCVVCLIDAERAWFKSCCGLEIREMPRNNVLCDLVVREEREVVIEDTHALTGLAGAPFASGPAGVRFYAGLPLRDPDGHVLGALSVLDTSPRVLTASQHEHLRALAALAMGHLVAHRERRRASRDHQDLSDHERFFENALELNCIADQDGVLLRVNRRWRQALGGEPDAFVGRAILQLIHPDDQETTLRALEPLRAGGALVSFRNRLRRHDGEYRWFEWNAHPASGPSPRIFASGRDITEAVKSGAALRYHNALLSLIGEVQSRFVAEGAAHAWWVFLLEQLLVLTESECGFIGVTGHDAQGPFLRTHAVTDITWEDATRVLNDARVGKGMVLRATGTPIGHALATGRRAVTSGLEHDHLAAGWPVEHTSLRTFVALPIFDGTRMVGLAGLANRSAGYDAALLDSLEPALAFVGAVLRNQALDDEHGAVFAKLEAAKELQDRVLESSESGFVAIRADGGLALVNRRARELLPALEGFRPERLPAGATVVVDKGGVSRAARRTLARLFPRDDDHVWLGALGGAQAAHLGPREVQVGGPGEAGRDIEVTATAIRDDGGAGTGVLLTLTDVSQRAALRETLQRNASLEERVNQLRRNQHDNEVLSECVEYLQNSVSLAEGLELVARSVERLFPGANIALYGASETVEALQLVRRATRFGAGDTADELTGSQCWAIRSRRAYGSWPGGHRLPCRHHQDAHHCAAFCVPLFSLDRNVAVFCVRFPPEEERRDSYGHEARMSQFVAMAQSVSGALSTIALRESLQRLALTDELTSLSNRRAFQLEAARAVARARRSGRPFSLCILDVDHFKSVNDTFGHDAGDQVLRQVAATLRQAVREGDLIARVGGEEFALLLPEISGEDALRRLSLTLQAVRTTCSVGGRPVTASMGVAHSSDFSSSATYEALYREADQALYAAKADGRDRLVRGPVPGALLPLRSGRES